MFDTALLTKLIRQGLLVFGGSLLANGSLKSSDVDSLAGALSVLLSVGWMLWTHSKEGRKQKAESGGNSAKLLLMAILTSLALPAIAVLLLMTGCARFSTTQTDVSVDLGGTNTTRTVTTKASAYTLFSAKSSLATWKANQTDKTQGASVGGLEQQGGTNAAATIQAIANLLSALPK